MQQCDDSALIFLSLLSSYPYRRSKNMNEKTYYTILFYANCQPT